MNQVDSELVKTYDFSKITLSEKTWFKTQNAWNPYGASSQISTTDGKLTFKFTTIEPLVMISTGLTLIKFKVPPYVQIFFDHLEQHFNVTMKAIIRERLCITVDNNLVCKEFLSNPEGSWTVEIQITELYETIIGTIILSSLRNIKPYLR